MDTSRHAGKIAIVPGAGSGIGRDVVEGALADANATWLASDEASNINGGILAADGGWSAA